MISPIFAIKMCIPTHTHALHTQIKYNTDLSIRAFFKWKLNFSLGPQPRSRVYVQDVWGPRFNLHSINKHPVQPVVTRDI